MAIDTEHTEYAKRKVQWGKLRDCVDGQEAIHEAGVKYLPKLSGQDADEYKAYKERTPFYGATSRTVDGLSGMVFRKEPQITVPGGMTDMMEDVTLDGLSLTGFAEQLIDDDIVTGRAGILVDHPVTTEGTSKAQAEASNMRPFLNYYTAESIYNWKVEGRNNAQITVQVRLKETAEVEGDSEFDSETVDQIRILDLDDEGYYRQRVYRETKNATTNGEKWIQFGDDVYPQMKGQYLTEIPFFFVGVKNGSAKTEKPPLIDLANINLSHYITTADLEHGAHFTGLPTAVITGHTEETGDGETGAEYRIGSASAWVFPDPETKVAYLEFQGSGLGTLENRINKKEEQMAFLGARMLASERKGVEAAETAQIHRSGEMSVLSSLAQSAGESIEKAVTFMAEWGGFSGEVMFKFNNDFLAIPMSAQQLTALFGVYQAGGMAFVDLLDNLKRGEIIREERTEEDIRSEIETSNPFDGEDLESGE
jgi:hypothetical protein